ncbi:MAG: EF-P lysine aminoacylase GenX [Deltaproteobacteria bacterium]|nr:EF-P lysine aminoacylase GenX [Deltaproteobacteria bacterium]
MSPASKNEVSAGNWKLALKKSNLAERARITTNIRVFFVERSFLEVSTPHRIPTNAPEIHINPIPSGDWQLHTSPELCMKRLLAAGYERLFQICPCWRQDELGSRHLPEFTLLEWYEAGADYRKQMTDCEELLCALVPGNVLIYQGREVILTRPWERLSISDAFSRYASISMDDALVKDRFDEIIALEIEPHLGIDKPLFLYDYPVEKAALAREKPGNAKVAERFELYVCGLELANGFSELNDAAEQRLRFEREETARRRTGRPPRPLPEKFLAELSAMPQAAGIALGLDRLIMLLTNAEKIDEVVAFTPEML